MNDADLTLIDSTLENAIRLQRFTAGEKKTVLAILEQLQRELKAKLYDQLTDFGKARVNKLLKEAAKTIDDHYASIQGKLDIDGLARHEAQATAQTIATISLEAAIPTDAVLRALVNGSLIEGAPSSAWWAKQSDDLAFRFANQVRQGIAANETVMDIVRRVAGSKKLGTPGIMEISRRNAFALVHTSIQQVANDARLATFKANSDIIKGVRQLSTLDGHTSKVCIAYSGATWDLDGNPIMGTTLPFNGGTPRHFNCLAGDTVISAAGVSKQYKRWFEGEVVVLDIAGINTVTITPNHPVLTDHGWVAAGLLKKGDNLVFCKDTDAMITLLNPDDNDMETRIEDVGDSLLMNGGMVAVGVPTSTEDFHGDGIAYKEIEIILAKCLLGDDLNVGPSEQIEKEFLSLGHAGITLDAEGVSAELLRGFPGPSPSDMGGICAGSSGLSPSADSLKAVPLTDAAEREPSPLEHLPDRPFWESQPLSNVVGGIPIQIRPRVDAEKFVVGINLAPDNLQAEASEPVPNSMAAVTDPLCDFVNRFSSYIGFVKIKNVAVRKYSSHVYNLQSDLGWYIVNITHPQNKSQGIIVHNCRSVLVPITKTYRELGVDIDEVPTGTRASDEGPVRADITMTEWLKGKPKGYVDDLLGPGRSDLFLSGKITLSDLVNQNGRPLTLKQLRGE